MTEIGPNQQLKNAELCHIVRETEFDQKIAQLSVIYSRIAELDDAIDWALHRNPTGFESIDDEYYLLVTEDLGVEGIPSLRVVYQYDPLENTVYLIDIEAI